VVPEGGALLLGYPDEEDAFVPFEPPQVFLCDIVLALSRLEVQGLHSELG